MKNPKVHRVFPAIASDLSADLEYTRQYVLALNMIRKYVLVAFPIHEFVWITKAQSTLKF